MTRKVVNLSVPLILLYGQDVYYELVLSYHGSGQRGEAGLHRSSTDDWARKKKFK